MGHQGVDSSLYESLFKLTAGWVGAIELGNPLLAHAAVWDHRCGGWCVEVVLGYRCGGVWERAGGCDGGLR